MGSRTARSAGVLATALATTAVTVALTVTFTVPGAGPAEADDCPKGGGLLGGVTGTVCDTVGKVTDTVDNVTGGKAKGLTDKVDDTTGKVLGKVGEAVPTARPGHDRKDDPDPSPTTTGTLLPRTLGEVCLPVLACDDQSVRDDRATPGPSATALAPAQRRTAQPGQPTRSGTARQRKDDGRRPTTAPTARPTRAATQPDSQPYLLDTREERIGEEPAADPEEPRIDLLWPHPLVRDLTAPLRDQQVLRPSAPTSDVLGTALTVLLLLSAVAATRVVQQRRHRSDQPDSIPFEPSTAANGRHRLA
ncbi:hypothetical protein GCM10010149_09630 [Nonomuraea roseoviolacea subsp. roseoviolacea]|uniref:Uncharacterized protein YjbJ (UPF0337 family) n=1 Tax=Nonomuraea roseoviolacea subsp. carminata TaxID=160689 RepID=A0ABT1KA60_9ACTN|nr:hypothetical protein [Nonomuraea roseoviolacea]MCP2350900.1 uncharacterized protein YjbJ (UPF0337 family) [Nonomuraea roseoviolacea subsp. carminata]